MLSTYHDQFDPYSKAIDTPGSDQSAFGQRDLSQTFPPQNMHGMLPAQTVSSISTQADTSFGDDAISGLSWLDDPALFDFDRISNEDARVAHTGQVTPGDSAWDLDEFFDYTPAST